MEFSSLLLHNWGRKMPKVGKQNHILGDFFSRVDEKNAKTGKEFGKEGKKVSFFAYL